MIECKHNQASMVVFAVLLCLLLGCGDDDGKGNDNNSNLNFSVCGNGRIDPGEECDEGAANSDFEPDACRTSCMQAYCGDFTLDSSEACDSGWGNSDEVPNACRTDCREPSCGDGVVDGAFGEECETGVGPNGSRCGGSCLLEYCGNGRLDPGEVCDDGNTYLGDGCSIDCQSNETCGNGIADFAVGETCDCGSDLATLSPYCTLPNGTDGGPCDASCNSMQCGNGVLDPGEVCDDGNLVAGDGCSPDCRSLEICGNGISDYASGEECDDGNAEAGDGCGPTCLLERCGNGVLDPGELCDDGNRVSGDGCSALCDSQERCGNGVLDPGEACDDGNLLDGDGCPGNCGHIGCGNGVLDPGEACDDGNQVDGDGCNSRCTSDETCGNGILDAARGETCDQGTANGVSPSLCRSDCRLTSCGDGYAGGAEACDDGNRLDRDGCSAACKREYRVGGTVTGLTGALVLQLNGGYDLSITTDGPFVFGTYLPDSTAYSVAVRSEPLEQRCRVSAGSSGTIIGADVTSVVVQCDFRTVFVDVSVGAAHACAVTNQGRAYCWGYNAWGQLGNGAVSLQEDYPSPVDATPLQAAESFVKIAAGIMHTCALTNQGRAYCWGSDDYGQLGNGGVLIDDQTSPSPVDVSTLQIGESFSQLTVADHSCGLTNQGRAYCWGRDDVGQLGNGGAIIGNQASPSPVDLTTLQPGESLVTIAAGLRYTCGTTDQGRAYCWGSDTEGVLGNGDILTADQPSPSPVDLSALQAGEVFVAMATGYSHSCGLTDQGRAYCWGANSYGSLGNLGDSSHVPVPVDISPLQPGEHFESLSVGMTLSFGVTSLGAAFGWGGGLYCILGNGTTFAFANSPAPIDDSNLLPGEAFEVVRTSAAMEGPSFSCGLTTQGRILCWGWDLLGQLGNGPQQLDRIIPYPVDDSML